MGFFCLVHQVTALEPELGLPLSSLHGLAGRDAVSTDVEAEVSQEDGAWGSLS